MYQNKRQFQPYNLFTTSDPPNIRIPILQNFIFVIEGGQENIFSLVQKIFSTNKNISLSPFDKQKQRSDKYL